MTKRSNAAAGRAVSTAVALTSLPGMALADTPPQAEVSGSELQEIVVTATKRAESLQDVPLSITALSGQSMERAGIVDFLDYAVKVPNLTFSSGHGIVDATSIAIRGIQGGGTTGFYIDDMPVPSTLDPRVIDLERIEVLRGPQGTLYGARSMGGTVRMITQAPDLTTFSGKLHTTGSRVEAGGGGFQVDGSVNIPLLVDRLAVRLTGFGGNDGSFINRSFPDPKNPATLDTVKTARKDFAGGMVSLLWKISDQLTVRPMLIEQYTSMNGWPLSDNSAGTLEQLRPFDIAEAVEDKWTYGGVTVSYTTPVGEVTSATSWFSRQDYESEDFSQQLSAIFATPLIPVALPTWQPTHTFVEELRFSSQFSGPVQLVTGIFLQHQQQNYDQYKNVPGLDASSGGTLGTDLVFQESNPTTQRESAAFGELTYQFAAHWFVTAGLRYSRIKEDSNDVVGGLAASGQTGGPGMQSEHRTTPKVALKYEPSSDSTYYALASSGFRPGNSQLAPPPSFCAADYASSGLSPNQLTQYKADSLWNYEIGSKNRLFDRRVSLNTALFWINWDSLQQTVLLSCGFPYVTNAGAARSRGGELELAFSLAEGLTFSTGVGYTDATITKSSPLTQARVGEPVQQIAPWTVSSDLDYTFALTKRWRGIAHLDNSYVDHSFSANNDPLHPRLRPSYDIANVRLGAGNDGYEIMAFVNNVSNTHANLGDNQSQAAELAGRPRILVNPPRTYGLSLTVRW